MNCITYSKACRGVGVEHTGGDMFDSVPEGDAIFMKVTGCDSASSFAWLTFTKLIACRGGLLLEPAMPKARETPFLFSFLRPHVPCVMTWGKNRRSY
jgi:hypothetical protein